MGIAGNTKTIFWSLDNLHDGKNYNFFIIY